MSYHYAIDICETGKNIKRIMEANGKTPKLICEYLELATTQSVYDWYAGRTLPSVDNMWRLALWLNISMNEFIMPIK